MAATLEKVIAGIRPVNQEWKDKAWDQLNNLAIPRGSLGELLALAAQISAIQETLEPKVTRKVVVTMAGDHGVVEEGVSAFPKEVTPQMVANFVAGGAAINVLARAAGARVVVVDMGVACDLTFLAEQGKILNYKVNYGTRNMAQGPAMTREEAIRSLEAGIEIVGRLVEEGVDLLGTGDMGIGNTTPSSAILAALTGQPVERITGRGTGIDDKTLYNKIQVIKKALQINQPNPSDPIDVLAKVGGYEIGGIAGLILGAAYHRIPVIIDGFISTAGALLAARLCPRTIDYMIAGHISLEEGHRHMLAELGLRPLLNLNLRLGEGTGAALAMNIVEGAARVISEMLTFEEAGVSRNRPEVSLDA